MKRLYYFEFRAMGCLMTAQIETHADGTDLLAQLPGKVEAIEARLSRFRPESELMRLNARAGEWVAVSEVLFDAVHAAKHAARLTDGLYNPLVLPAMLANGYDRSFEQIDQPAIRPAVPAADWRGIGLRVKTREVRLPAGSAIDLGGIGKGWTAARLTDDLRAHGACLVNLGGDITAQGSPENLPGWHVNIEDPHSGQSFIALWLHQGTVVTSGIDYRRWVTADGQTHHHIVHPMTGLPAQTDIVSATIIHPHAPTAEAYAKAVLLKGSMDGLNWLQKRWYAAGMVIRQDGGVLATSNFDHFTHERIIS